jgi:hypothetical protein
MLKPSHHQQRLPIRYGNLSRLGTLARGQTAMLTSRLQDPDMFVRWSSLRVAHSRLVDTLPPTLRCDLQAFQWLAPNVHESTVGAIVEVLNTDTEGHVTDQASTTLSTVSRQQRALVKKWQEGVLPASSTAAGEWPSAGDRRAPWNTPLSQSAVDSFLPVHTLVYTGGNMYKLVWVRKTTMPRHSRQAQGLLE